MNYLYVFVAGLLAGGALSYLFARPVIKDVKAAVGEVRAAVARLLDQPPHH